MHRCGICRGTRSSTAATADGWNGSVRAWSTGPAPGAVEPRRDAAACGTRPTSGSIASPAGPEARRSPWTIAIDGVIAGAATDAAGPGRPVSGASPVLAMAAGRGRRPGEAGDPPPLRLNRGDDARARRGPAPGHPRRRGRGRRSAGPGATRSCPGSRTGRSAGSSTTSRRSSRGRLGAGGRYDGVVLDPPSYGHGAGGGPGSSRRPAPICSTARRAPSLRPTRSSCSRRIPPGLEPDRLGDALDGRLPAPGHRGVERRRARRCERRGRCQLGVAARMIARHEPRRPMTPARGP